jgi:dihydrofolate reductase
MTISLVVAAAKNNGIGKNGAMPWHLPADLKHFKNTTWAMPVVMGRKTFESIGKALVGRRNIVITRQSGWEAENVLVVRKIEDAIQMASETDAKEVMVIGGGEIYQLLFDKARRIYLTRVDASPDADTFFPAIHSHEWNLISQQDHEADEKNAYNYSFQLWERT